MNPEQQLPCWSSTCRKRFDTWTALAQHHYDCHRLPDPAVVSVEGSPVIGYAASPPRRWGDVRTLWQQRNGQNNMS